MFTVAAVLGGVKLIAAIVGVLMLAAMMAPKLVGGIPTPQDENLLLQDTVTKTATFNSAGLDLGAGFAPGGLGMPVAGVVDVSAIDRGTGDETYTFKLQESDDNASFADCGVATASLTATGVVACKGFLTKRYARLVLTAGGTTPSITYKAWLNTLHR